MLSSIGLINSNSVISILGVDMLFIVINFFKDEKLFDSAFQTPGYFVGKN